MELSDYQRLAARTLDPARPFDDRLTNSALGLAGEAGETVDYIKKVLFHSHPLDRAKLADELGDVLWYLAALATTCDLALSDIAAHNIAKLQRRYPNGFSADNSLARVDVENR